MTKLTSLANSVRNEPRTAFGPGFDVLRCLYHHTEQEFSVKLESVYDLGDFYNIPFWEIELLLLRGIDTPAELADILLNLVE
jgi:hypothetical protein